MVMAYRIKPSQRDRIPAVKHGDGAGRPQTGEQDVNPLHWKLIKKFEDLTGVPVLLNTSFNENEPIVDTPARGYRLLLANQDGSAHHRPIYRR
jgi:carbamoyltransferase